MPITVLEVIDETGSPGMSRGRIKLIITAAANVMKNHIIFLVIYFLYPFMLLTSVTEKGRLLQNWIPRATAPFSFG